MRLASIANSILFFSEPCVANDVPNGFEVEGECTLNVDAEPLELTSISNSTSKFNDPYFLGNPNFIS